MNKTIKLSISGLMAFIIWGVSALFGLPVHTYGIMWFVIGMPLSLTALIFVAHHERESA